MTTVYSVRESILAAMIALIDVPNVTVYRSREAAIARAEGIALVIRPEEEGVTTLAHGLADRSIVVVVTVIARGPIPDQTADPIIALFHGALMASENLSGLVARIIEESTKWDFEVADQNAVAIEVRYRIKFLTATSSLTATT